MSSFIIGWRRKDVQAKDTVLLEVARSIFGNTTGYLGGKESMQGSPTTIFEMTKKLGNGSVE